MIFSLGGVMSIIFKVILFFAFLSSFSYAVAFSNYLQCDGLHVLTGDWVEIILKNNGNGKFAGSKLVHRTFRSDYYSEVSPFSYRESTTSSGLVKTYSSEKLDVQLLVLTASNGAVTAEYSDLGGDNYVPNILCMEYSNLDELTFPDGADTSNLDDL